MSPAARPQLHLESFGMSSSETSQNLPIQPSPENSAGEQPVSQRRIEANRRNALRSTGPKSARGKDMAARNSWKHGLLAKSAVIMLGPAKENKAEFEELLSGLRDYFGPGGTAEELLVEEIIKISSRGPVFFRQQRMGQYGVPFVFLKFRSMYAGSDPTSHRNYVSAS